MSAIFGRFLEWFRKRLSHPAVAELHGGLHRPIVGPVPLQMTFGNKCFQKLLLQVRYRTFLCSATDRHGFPPSPALKAVSARIVFHDGTRWLVLTFAASPVFNLIPAFLKSISAEINLDPDAAYPVQLILRRLPALLQ
jgi:hypothetical protein